MSSRRLLTLIRYLPDESATKTAARDDWPEDTYISAAVVNEIRLMRADLAAIFGGGGEEPNLFRSPGQEKAIAEREKAREGLRNKVLAQLNRKGG